MIYACLCFGVDHESFLPLQFLEFWIKMGLGLLISFHLVFTILIRLFTDIH